MPVTEHPELEQITIRLQDNGEGRVSFRKRIRFRREDGSRAADGDAIDSGIWLSDFREQSFTLAEGKTVTGAEFQQLCGLIADEMEQQAAARERDNRRARRQAEERKAQIEAEQKRLADEQAALASQAQQADAEAEAELQQIAVQHRGRAERGG